MRTLRKLPAASLSVGCRHFPPSRPTPDAPLCTKATGNCSCTEARIALSACKDRPLSAGLMPLTVLGANAHGPPDSDKRMCAQR